ncbi:hypothetical protein Moror_9798 [Moniliophthora roreri MCA 2997]|uniref:G-protein coupled receptors family 2 profile 2 domain-containing protein n=1 Tax=Moniliophthora roreri (strain MCA 2997) TaxID=1381753 RepID=V2X280_MONRO|nr:hypothetical protein Moror_9798 [Moniliophthora roreri MCA 2997]
MAFEFTNRMATISNQLWAITSAVGAGLCFLVLLVIAAVYTHPKSRAHLDRVSFRIVVYALIANMIFGISSAVGGTRTGPGFICGFSIFVLQLTLQLSSFLLFCIALNLQLVVVHGVNGQRMEKFYLVISALFTIVLVVPPYAAGQYGWDPLEQDCWYTNDNRTERIVWQVTTQMAWTALTVVGEVICSTVVLVFMLKHNVRTRRIFVPTSSFSHASSAPQVLHANRYRNIILRVALYPTASCCVNLLSVVTALHSTVSHGIHDQTDYNVLLLSDFLYGGRAIVYALLAASDPALVRGVRVLFSQVIYGTQGSISSTGKTVSSQRQTEVFVELSTIQAADIPPTTDVADKPVDTSSIILPDTTDPNKHHTSNRGNSPDVEFEIGSPDPSHLPPEGARPMNLQRRRAEIRRKDREEEEIFKKQI